MSPLTWKLAVFPLLGWPTRRQLDANCGYDKEKLARLSVYFWKIFRATAIGCGTGWLVIVGLLCGLTVATGEPFEWRFAQVTTAIFGSAVLVNYPWPFREQGSRWLRWLVLAVGVPSAGLFAASLLGLW